MYMLVDLIESWYYRTKACLVKRFGKSSKDEHEDWFNTRC